jgi:copper chaperone CopZ
VSVAVRKVEGVESIDVSLEKAVADIRLKPGNRVTLAQLRAAIKKNGYATRDADVEARGKIVLSNGTAMLDLVNGSTIPLDRAPKEGATDQIVQISGVARNGAGGDMLTDIKVR